LAPEFQSLLGARSLNGDFFVSDNRMFSMPRVHVPQALLPISLVIATLCLASLLPLVHSKAQVISTSTCCKKMDWTDEFKDCKAICRAYVHYPSIQSCVINETCSYLLKDWGKLQATLKASKQALSVPCDMSAKRALCAYHFPRCFDDQRILGHMVCDSTCQDMQDDCSLGLDQITTRPKCIDRNVDCSNPASVPTPLHSILLLLSTLSLALLT